MMLILKKNDSELMPHARRAPFFLINDIGSEEGVGFRILAFSRDFSHFGRICDRSVTYHVV